MRRILFRSLFAVLILTIVVFTCFPFFYMISTSFKAATEIYDRPPTLLPKQMNIQPYLSLFLGLKDSIFDFRLGFMNSLRVASVSTVLAMLVASSAAYGLSRFRFRGRKFIGQSILVTQVLPGVVLLLPIYILFGQYNLLNSHFGLSLAHITFVIPFSTWMLKGFFDTVPTSIDEQAMIDGCRRWTAFFRIMLPIIRSGLAATSIFSFILSWNEFLFAIVFLNRYEKWTLSVGLTSFRGQYLIQWNEMMACSVMITIPIFAVYIFLQKYLVSGMTAGAVKQ